MNNERTSKTQGGLKSATKNESREAMVIDTITHADGEWSEHTTASFPHFRMIVCTPNFFSLYCMGESHNIQGNKFVCSKVQYCICIKYRPNYEIWIMHGDKGRTKGHMWIPTQSPLKVASCIAFTEPVEELQLIPYCTTPTKYHVQRRAKRNYYSAPNTLSL